MTETRSITLYCREGSSDKEYRMSLETAEGGFVVAFCGGLSTGNLACDEAVRVSGRAGC